jgi:hypothetical protein
MLELRIVGLLAAPARVVSPRATMPTIPTFDPPWIRRLFIGYLLVSVKGLSLAATASELLDP